MPLTFSLSNKFLELNRVSLFLDPKGSVLRWRIIEASGFCVLIKSLSVSRLDTDSNLISKEIWVNNYNLCLMHELKFLIAFRKKNQRLFMEGIIHVEEKKKPNCGNIYFYKSDLPPSSLSGFWILKKLVPLMGSIKGQERKWRRNEAISYALLRKSSSDLRLSTGKWLGKVKFFYLIWHG